MFILVGMLRPTPLTHLDLSLTTTWVWNSRHMSSVVVMRMQFLVMLDTHCYITQGAGTGTWPNQDSILFDLILHMMPMVILFRIFMFVQIWLKISLQNTIALNKRSYQDKTSYFFSQEGIMSVACWLRGWFKCCTTFPLHISTFSDNPDSPAWATKEFVLSLALTWFRRLFGNVNWKWKW